MTAMAFIFKVGKFMGYCRECSSDECYEEGYNTGYDDGYNDRSNYKRYDCNDDVGCYIANAGYREGYYQGYNDKRSEQ